jgi:hypothetical protein
MKVCDWMKQLALGLWSDRKLRSIEPGGAYLALVVGCD